MGTVLFVVVPIIVAVVIISGGEYFGYLLDKDTLMGCCTILGYLLSMVAVLVNFQLARKRAEAKIAEIDKEKPGFQEFYRLWKKQQDDETNQALGSLAAGALLSGAEELRRRERLRSDARIIRDELRKK
jgi:hypothetical protein